ncbi:[LSU ribosomal protein L11P]-lysine N-methyltransferase [Nitrosospira sp. Nsp18]|uniref:50S ribosomal protein L11 methyltransferase n=1 Tax=Nitrosospira sp. Nsp18 TaxID=1855334 RepID=UPI000882D614|nr:50S ribosomal protein L11 methyltransferase [Nitrosospira sp. Nsp18]SDA16559.1 [LSU ribosomal protein L11P]-lysine N-methyltransferase [Nitrosospira sp. Nsp18]
MAWISLAIETDSAHAEALGDALLELGALSTDIHDAASGTDREQLLFDEPGEPSEKIWLASELTALFNEDVDIASTVQAAANAAQLPCQPSYRITHVEEQDWVRMTQSQFTPIQISFRLWIVPSWHEIPDTAAVNLILDPGLAFGTGSHPSTQLCLGWLDETLRGGEDVLDYGCGSGILAIAALKLGAGHVVGIDIDPQAVAASRANAILNQCDETKAEFFATPVTDRAGSKNGAWADVVVANILANPLIVLAPLLMHATRKGGHIALSGILMEQAEDVIQIYRQWFDIHITREQAGWALLTGTRK